MFSRYFWVSMDKVVYRGKVWNKGMNVSNKNFIQDLGSYWYRKTQIKGWPFSINFYFYFKLIGGHLNMLEKLILLHWLSCLTIRSGEKQFVFVSFRVSNFWGGWPFFLFYSTLHTRIALLSMSTSLQRKFVFLFKLLLVRLKSIRLVKSRTDYAWTHNIWMRKVPSWKLSAIKNFEIFSYFNPCKYTYIVSLYSSYWH